MTDASAPVPNYGEMFASTEAAAAWERQHARGTPFADATEMMLEFAKVGTSSRVLDVGAGTGLQTLAAAKRVGPRGYVLATDISASMLALAAEAARQAGLTNVETRVLDAQQLDLPPASFDAAISRQVLMLIPDRAATLAGVRSALRPGGRLAVTVFSSAENNPYHAMPLSIAGRYAQDQSALARDVGMFALGNTDVLARAFEAAGLREVSVQAVPGHRRYASVSAAIAEMREGFPVLAALLTKLSEEECRKVWTEIGAAMRQFESSDGLTVPSEVLVAAGTNP